MGRQTVVTGGTGFLGQHLIPLLAAEGELVRVVDLQPQSTLYRNVVPFCEAVTYGVDVTKPETLRGQFQGASVVYHLAGIVSFWSRHAQRLHEVNAQGTINVLAEAHRANVGRVVHVSSIAAIGYGNKPGQIVDESLDFDWKQVRHKAYVASKHEGEVAAMAAVARGQDVVIANPGLLWGPGDRGHGPKLIDALRKGRIMANPPGGTNVVDVRDVARSLVRVAKRGVAGRRYVLGGYNLKFMEINAILAGVLKVPPPTRTLPTWTKPWLYGCARLLEKTSRRAPALTADQVESMYVDRYHSSDRAAKELGWRAEIPFEQSIVDLVAWLAEVKG